MRGQAHTGTGTRTAASRARAGLCGVGRNVARSAQQTDNVIMALFMPPRKRREAPTNLYSGFFSNCCRSTCGSRRAGSTAMAHRSSVNGHTKVRQTLAQAGLPNAVASAGSTAAPQHRSTRAMA